MTRRFTVMGAGELGTHLARTLHQEGHDVVLIDVDPERRSRVEDELDLSFVVGNATQIPVLEQAGVAGTELFIAASNSEEANLTASVLAKDLGAKRTAVRLETTEELTTYRSRYETLFHADLLLSPQVLATTQILNIVLGHNTHEIDFLAQGRIQLRTIDIQPGCDATQSTLREIAMPPGSLVVGYLDAAHELSIPTPDQHPQAGGQALVLCTSDAAPKVEKLFSSRFVDPEQVVIGGAGRKGIGVARALRGRVGDVKLIERDRRKAERVAAAMPDIQVIHGDATDANLLRAERADKPDAFVAAMAHDETNLLACLIAQEAGAREVIAVVRRTETSRLWKQTGRLHVVSPRFLAAERITDYIRNGYKPNLISLEGGALKVFQRTIHPASAVVGVSLEELNPPHGLLVGAVVRDEDVFVPNARDRMESGDQVILFVHRAELPTVRLLFPGPEELT
ncbi:MAG TPA: Trk system potassium transporter TrkA [Thermoanaerobaculia bacterium]|nr:Trk system potassium transporter TrkA [Thermoanaerobaculia bacterium]